LQEKLAPEKSNKPTGEKPPTSDTKRGPNETRRSYSRLGRPGKNDPERVEAISAVRRSTTQELINDHKARLSQRRDETQTSESTVQGDEEQAQRTSPQLPEEVELCFEPIEPDQEERSTTGSTSSDDTWRGEDLEDRYGKTETPFAEHAALPEKECIDLLCLAHRHDKPHRTTEFWRYDYHKEPICGAWEWTTCYHIHCKWHMREKLAHRWWPMAPEEPCGADEWISCNWSHCQEHLPPKRAYRWFPGPGSHEIHKRIIHQVGDMCGELDWRHCFIDYCKWHTSDKLDNGWIPPRPRYSNGGPRLAMVGSLSKN